MRQTPSLPPRFYNSERGSGCVRKSGLDRMRPTLWGVHIAFGETGVWEHGKSWVEADSYIFGNFLHAANAHLVCTHSAQTTGEQTEGRWATVLASQRTESDVIHSLITRVCGCITAKSAFTKHRDGVTSVTCLWRCLTCALAAGSSFRLFGQILLCAENTPVCQKGVCSTQFQWLVPLGGGRPVWFFWRPRAYYSQHIVSLWKPT